MKSVNELIAAGAEAVVVDDLPSAQKIVARLLTRLGFQKVYQCDCAEQAYRVISNHHRVRVLVSDVNMPTATGPDLVKRLEGKEFDAPLIIVMTTGGDPDGVVTCSYNGLPLHPLLKPFSGQDLAARIEDYLLALGS